MMRHPVIRWGVILILATIAVAVIIHHTGAAASYEQEWTP